MKKLLSLLAVLALVGCARLTITSSNGTKTSVSTFLDANAAVTKIVNRSGTNGTFIQYIGGLSEASTGTNVVLLLNTASGVVTKLGTTGAIP